MQKLDAEYLSAIPPLPGSYGYLMDYFRQVVARRAFERVRQIASVRVVL
jgi:hypothetical protein